LDAPGGREDIKRAALEEFARHGFKGASVDQIAERAGVAKRLVHYHFESKAALWKQAVAEAYNEFHKEALAFAAGLTQQTPEAALEAFANQMVRFAADRVWLIQISMDETRQRGARADWLKATYLVPLQRLMIEQTTSVLGNRADAKAVAAHLVPAIFGAAVFPFVDAEVTREAHETDVFGEAYIARHADFMTRLLLTCLDEFTA